jgi:hypothetical protein
MNGYSIGMFQSNLVIRFHSTYDMQSVVSWKKKNKDASSWCTIVGGPDELRFQLIIKCFELSICAEKITKTREQVRYPSPRVRQGVDELLTWSGGNLEKGICEFLKIEGKIYIQWLLFCVILRIRKIQWRVNENLCRHCDEIKTHRDSNAKSLQDLMRIQMKILGYALRRIEGATGYRAWATAANVARAHVQAKFENLRKRNSVKIYKKNKIAKCAKNRKNVMQSIWTKKTQITHVLYYSYCLSSFQLLAYFGYSLIWAEIGS